MSPPSWFIYTPLAAHDALGVVDAWEHELERYLAEYPDFDIEPSGELNGGGSVPSLEEAEETARTCGFALPERVRERLARCRSSIEVAYPGSLDLDRCQVSMLRYVVERAGPSLASIDSENLVLSEVLLARLKSKRGLPRFPVPAPKAKKPVRTRSARDGEVRALQILSVLKVAQTSPEVALDVRDALSKAPSLARRYAALLMEEGAQSDVKARRTLGVDRGDFERDVAYLAKAFTELLE